jgi:hypothetical protein
MLPPLDDCCGRAGSGTGLHRIRRVKCAIPDRRLRHRAAGFARVLQVCFLAPATTLAENSGLPSGFARK